MDLVLSDFGIFSDYPVLQFFSILQRFSIKRPLKENALMSKVTAGSLLVTLGIVFGDIGTSPLYVLQAIIGDKVITEDLVIGGVSCIFWTLTLQTTIKYVVFALRADNNGEGGTFSLYALVRRTKAKYLVFAAILGGSALIADGFITPPISITSAVEGLKIFNEDIPTTTIAIIIITALFIFQQFGTGIVGKAFGPIMLVWFVMLTVMGLLNLSGDFHVFKALNPYYAITLLTQYPGGFWILGGVFLCTTGAEALYTDLGHVGRRNIRITWIFVKISLIINYFGQGAWLLQHIGDTLDGKKPFYALMPDWFLICGILISTAATVIASQALISGAFTLVNEAIRLNFGPKLKIRFPTVERGQLYIPYVNWFLWAGCVAITLYFRESTNMEAAYGLAIVIAFMSDTILLNTYMILKRYSLASRIGFIGLFVVIEIAFLVANLQKFVYGGWITLLITFFLMTLMFVWFRARKIKHRYTEFIGIKDYLPLLKDLSNDLSVPKFSTHLVYLTSANRKDEIESKIIYSIFQKQPKRADVYWFIHVDVMDEPYRMEYKVIELLPGKVIKIDFRLGFRVQPRINIMFRQVVQEMVKNHEVDITSRYQSLNRQNVIGDFRFIVMERFLSIENDLPFYDKYIMDLYFIIKEFGLSEEKAFGLDTSTVLVEKVPMILAPREEIKLQRIE